MGAVGLNSSAMMGERGSEKAGMGERCGWEDEGLGEKAEMCSTFPETVI